MKNMKQPRAGQERAYPNPKGAAMYPTKVVHKFIDGLTDEEIEANFYIDLEPPKEELPDLITQIIQKAQSIQKHDMQFQNLNSEIEQAEKVAAQMVRLYHDIIPMLRDVPEEHAFTVREALKVTDYMYMRVLGDRLCNFKEYCQRVDYERKIKDLWRDKGLEMKCKRYKLKAELTKKRISKVYGLELHVVRDAYHNL